MPRLTKIYTRAGDDGSTGLGGGQRVPKDALRVETYGTVDELNSAIGVARAHGLEPGLDEELRRIHRSDVREVHVVEEDVRSGLPRELEDVARAAGKTLPPRGGAVPVS